MYYCIFICQSVSAPVAATKVNTNAMYAASRRGLQPHQGMNPTAERNTHRCSDEELAVLGNVLVEKAAVSACVCRVKQ